MKLGNALLSDEWFDWQISILHPAWLSRFHLFRKTMNHQLRQYTSNMHASIRISYLSTFPVKWWTNITDRLPKNSNSLYVFFAEPKNWRKLEILVVQFNSENILAHKIGANSQCQKIDKAETNERKTFHILLNAKISLSKTEMVCKFIRSQKIHPM